jgi:hypothetical protein
MKKVWKAVWTEVDLIEIKDGESFKFTEEGEIFVADGDAYLGNDNEALVRTVEDNTREYEDDGK